MTKRKVFTRTRIAAAALVLVLGSGARALPALTQGAQNKHDLRSASTREAHWRPASEKELSAIIPERAPVISERIETELRTASAVVDGKGHFIAAATLITAGYSANGKYSVILMTQVPLRIADHMLQPGSYLLGWTRGDKALQVTISEAMTGKPLLTVAAAMSTTDHRVEPIHVWPPQNRSEIQLGRFVIPYQLEDSQQK